MTDRASRAPGLLLADWGITAFPASPERAEVIEAIRRVEAKVRWSARHGYEISAPDLKAYEHLLRMQLNRRR